MELFTFFVLGTLLTGLIIYRMGEKKETKFLCDHFTIEDNKCISCKAVFKNKEEINISKNLAMIHNNALWEDMND